MRRELNIFTLLAPHSFSLRVKSSSLSLICGSPKSKNGVTDGRSMQLLLVYLNIDHAYVILHLFDSHTHIHKISGENLVDRNRDARLCIYLWGPNRI
ncbi:hypothetical protein P3S67_012952 [Capsicum chacoense]